MRCSPTCFLIFSSLIMMTGGFVLTLSGWFAPAIREAVFRVRMAGPLILLAGFFLLLSSCALCAYHQRRCCLCCYGHDTRKNIYPGSEYAFTDRMVEIGAPAGLNTLSYEYQNEAGDFDKSLSAPEGELVWHKKQPANSIEVTDEIHNTQMKPLLSHYEESKSPNEWKLRGCHIQLKPTTYGDSVIYDGNSVNDATRNFSANRKRDNHTTDHRRSDHRQTGRDCGIYLPNDEKVGTIELNESFNDFYSSNINHARLSPPSPTEIVARHNASSKTEKKDSYPKPYTDSHVIPQLKGILKTQSLDRTKNLSSSLRNVRDTSSVTQLNHRHATKTHIETNGIGQGADDKQLRQIKTQTRPSSLTDHTTCPIVSTPPISNRKIILPRPGSYRDINSKNTTAITRPSPDRSPLLGLPKQGWTKSIPTSIV